MFLNRLRKGLKKTRKKFQNSIRTSGILRKKNLKESLPVFEEILLTSDVGVEATRKILAKIEENHREFSHAKNMNSFLRQILTDVLNSYDEPEVTYTPPHVILTAGVNGTGKTTTVAKLAHLYKKEKENVLLVASDTYRAAGVEQLSTWGEVIGVHVLKSQRGQDPASVVYDSLESAFSKKYTTVLVDTAGRLHTQKNLMGELKKIKKVMRKKRSDLPQETILVLDATTGQNALNQAEIFNESLEISSIILTKIDGTAKGGIIFALWLELGIPIQFLGVGENVDDLIKFEPHSFVASLLYEEEQ
jgi:fused signal recognition particle receptor